MLQIICVGTYLLKPADVNLIHNILNIVFPWFLLYDNGWVIVIGFDEQESTRCYNNVNTCSYRKRVHFSEVCHSCSFQFLAFILYCCLPLTMFELYTGQ